MAASQRKRAIGYVHLCAFILLIFSQSCYSNVSDPDEKNTSNSTVESTSCPMVSACQCYCNPVITLSCPAPPTPTCPDSPTTSTEIHYSTTTFSPTDGSTLMTTLLPTSNPPTTDSTITSTTTPSTTTASTTTSPTTTTRPTTTTTPSTTSPSTTTSPTTIATPSSTPSTVTTTISTTGQPTDSSTPTQPTSPTSSTPTFSGTSSTSKTTTVQPPNNGTWTTGSSGPMPSTTGPILDNCDALLQTVTGSFSSPYYPNNYPDNANCSWLITSSGRIQLFFNQFRTEYQSDFVKVYDGPTVSSSRLLSHSGTSTPSSVISSGYQMLITFSTDSSITDTGFNATYSLYVPPTNPPEPPPFVCGENITLISGSDVFLTSPGFPNGYPNNSRCTWYISSEPGTKIQFHFTDFSTRNGDYVNVYDYDKSTLVKNYNGNVSTETCGFLTNGNTMQIVFSSGFTSSIYPGFRARLSIDHGCDRNYTENQGIIETPGYQTNTTFTFPSCTWRIRVATGSRVNLTLTDWIGWSDTDSDHSFEVYDGSGTNWDNLIARAIDFTSSLNPFFIISKSNEMTISVRNYKYRSSSSSSSAYGYCPLTSSENNKLRVSYTATPTSKYGCYGSMDTSTRAISSPGYPKEYTPRLLTCHWKISEPAGSKISLAFPVIIDTYTSDYLHVHDGPEPDSPVIFRVSGTVHPQPVVSSTNETTIRFLTDRSIDNATLYMGWSATWSRVN